MPSLSLSFLITAVERTVTSAIPRGALSMDKGYVCWAAHILGLLP